MLSYFTRTIVLAVTEESNTVSQQLQPSMAGLFLRVVMGLVIIVLLTYLILRVIKRQQDMQQKIRNDRRGWVRIYDYQALGPNRGLYLIEMFSGICVVGVTENGISILKEISQDNEEWLAVKEMLNNPEEIIPPGLARFLKNNISLFHKKDSSNEDFTKELSQRLNAEVNDQLDRTHRLYRRTTGGRNDGE